MALSSDSGKALWIVPVPEFGGVARHVLDVARAGLPGYELYVLAPEGALTRSLKELGVKVFADRSFGTEAGFKSSYCRRSGCHRSKGWQAQEARPLGASAGNNRARYSR